MGAVPPKFFLPSAPYGSSQATTALSPVAPAAQNPQTPLLPPNFTDPGTMSQQTQQNPMNPSLQSARPQSKNPLYGMFGRGLFALLLLLPSSLWATTTVTGKIQNLGTGNITSGAFVRFWLRGCAGNQPRVNGTSVIGPTQGGVFFFDLAADGSGNVSGALYSTRDAAGTGNGDIECGGSKTAVWYGMQIWVAGKAGPEVAVHAKNTATLDITQVTPITTNPVVTSPTGDTTYLRLDGGNSPETGNVDFTGNNTACQLNSVLYVGGSITCWAGADIGAQINTAYAALPSTGGKIYILPQTGGGCYNFSTPIVLQTSGKYAPLEGIYTGDQTGAVSQGVCLNYTPTTATIAMTLDYSPAAGGDYTGFTALANIMLKNNGCATVGGCASSATGVKTGVINGGIHFGTFKNVILQGFGTGLNFAEASGVGWAFQSENTSIVFNTTGLTFGTLHEQMHWIGGTIAGNGTGINVPNATDANFAFVSLDINTLGINNVGGNISFTGCHWENSGGSGTVQYLTQSTGNFVIHAGEMLNDTNSGTVAQMITTTGGFFQIEGLTIFSGGQTVTNLINNTGGGVGDATYFTGSPSLIAPAVYATCATPYNCHVKRLTGATPQLVAPILTIPFAGGGLPAGTAAAGMLGYNAGTNRTQLNDNNGGFSNVLSAASTDTLTNKTLTAPTMNGITNGTGLQVFNTTTTCTTGASVGATCTTAAITLPVAEADTSYRMVCTGKGLTNVPVVIATTNSSSTQFTITIAALTAAAASFASYDCTAGHN